MKSLAGAVKFCGGCNPRYDRGGAYAHLREALSDVCAFESAQPGRKYDVLVILRGCTGCPYLYEEITADERLICTEAAQLDGIIERIRALASKKDNCPPYAD